ncbi:MAG: chromosome segregation protein SMC [Aquificaceae bacterium]|uniref:chromosome segregation protein SMC n=1 Tax=Hydrogenobacter sp. Uz 6-8 TaxID=3384828 RepID=UPI0030B627E5
MKAWIEKITLEGFKSYGKERVEIPLGQGFIGVVGPNGAGKSNIGDAISFALGIATAKTLRARNLSYLIYSKDSDRAEYAYVEVHFKNHGLFPLQDEDIVISRKVYQDGRTVFRINGAVVREKDLMDFLSKAGIYENAYNVVLQGDIVRFLKMTPVERRKLLEEIAGIEEYEEKKQRALADLGEVELKLRELRLLMDEMEVQMEKLREELKRLNLYRELEEKRRSIDIRLTLKTAYELKKSVNEVSEKISSKEEELQRLRERIKAYEERLLHVEKELKDVSENLFPFREKVGRLSQSIENMGQSLEKHERRIDNLRKDIFSTQEQIASLERQKEILLREEENLLRAIEGEEVELLGTEESANLLWKSIKEREESLKVSLEEMERTEEKLRELSTSLEEARKELSRMELKLRELELKKERVKEDMERLREEERKIKANMGESLMKRENYQKMLKEEERSIRVKKEEYQRLEERLKKIRQEKEEVLKEIAMLKGRLQSMPPEELPFEGIEGVYGRASGLIKVRDLEYLRAVEVAGGGRLSYIVVQDEDVAKRCIQRLKELKWGRLNFIPLSRIRETNLPPYPPRHRGVIDFIVNLLEYEKRFEKAIRFIFGDTLLVDGFDTARGLGNSYRMVTLDGELFEKSGVISGGHSEERGELGRGFYLEELNRLLQLEEKLREEEAKEEKLLKMLRDELLEKESVIAILRRRLEEVEETDRSGYERLKDIQEKLQKAEEYVHILEGEKEETKKKTLSLKEDISYLEEKLENLSIKRQSVLLHYRESGVEDLRREYEKEKQKMEKLRESIHSHQLKLRELQIEKESLQKEIGRKLAFVESAQDEIEKLGLELEELRKERQQLEEELKHVNMQAYELYRKKDRLEEEHRSLQSELGRLRFQEESLKEELHRLWLERAKLEERYKESLSRLRELGYEGEVVEIKEGSGRLREELSKVIKELSSLGSVNFKAEEEYREYEERHSDYQERYRRLKEEKESIKELIQEVETKKLRAFMETFQAVDRNLRRIFSELSPGGKAYMVLEREDDPLSGGVSLVVKPRGKEVQYLEAISGGEKTLAALSLIFAIQDYRPSPFYYFDEVDAHLDEANARRVGELLKERSKGAQFIVVTLREVLASFADRVIGVSGRGGLSRVFTLENPAELLTG